MRIPPSVPALPNATDAVTEPGAIAAELDAGGQAILTRPPDAHADAVDGILPRIVVEAESRAAVAATLQWAGQRSLSVVIRGSGTKFGWGAVPAPFDVLLDVSRVNRVLDHRAGDLTVSVEAGARLGDVNELLRQRGQWLALDPPFAEAATIGGLLATNDSGPQRHRFGTPRDLVIGIEIATMDGQIAKAGGQVVKNVAGYDLSKIMSGSFGSLGAIVAATFKLSPLPAASTTVLVPHLDSDATVRVVEAIAASQLEPVAFELDMRAPRGGTPEIACLLRFASVPAAVEAETANASGRVATVHPAFRVLTGDKERDLWRRPRPAAMGRAGHHRSRELAPWKRRGTAVGGARALRRRIDRRHGQARYRFRAVPHRRPPRGTSRRRREDARLRRLRQRRRPARAGRAQVARVGLGIAGRRLAHRRAEARARSGRAPGRGARSAVTHHSHRDVQAVSEPAFDAHHPPAAALIDKCVHCGFCLPTCPTYALWGEEMDSPRGRLYLMKSGLEGRIGMTERFVGHFDACLGCMACVTACPSGVEYGPLIEDTRAQIERRFPRSAGERLFRKAIFMLVPYPRRMRLALLPAVLYRRIQPLLAQSGLLDRLPHRVRALAKLAPPVSIRGLTARTPGRTPASGERRLTVGLLTGCVQRLVFSHVNEATIRVLAAEGCEVLAPPAQGCCGALAVHAGRPEEARAFARRTIEAFETSGVERVVVNAAGCGSSMKEYDRLLADDPQWAERARAFTARVRDVTELLVELGPPRAVRRRMDLRVAYHDACHLAHAQGIRAEPRELLRQIPGVELVPFAEGELCCGSAGIYNLLEPEPAQTAGKAEAAPHHRRAPRRHRHGQPGMHAAADVGRGGGGHAGSRGAPD